jgi:hypothetical protein
MINAGEAMHSPIDDGQPSAATRSQDGASLALDCARRHPGQDWLAALAKGARMNRAEVEDHLRATTPAPRALVDAARDLDALLAPPDADASDHVFAAETNSDAAPMEVDAEAGMIVTPGEKPRPSQSGSRHEAGAKPEAD